MIILSLNHCVPITRPTIAPIPSCATSPHRQPRPGGVRHEMTCTPTRIKSTAVVQMSTQRFTF
ncbi:hypothetical protein [Lysobacter gummosus]|uniref:hypothetical protein n=1 Tax=Lysobacter gummosus TaxID=262324 RepID=UPI00364397EA